MNFRKLLLASAATAAASASFVTPTQASIIDRPHFKVEPIIIVWAADDTNGNAGVVTDFIVGSGSNDLIATNGRTLTTGTLNPTEDAASTATLGNLLSITDGSTEIQPIDTSSASTFSAFDVTDAEFDSNVVRNASFFVASNTGFQIHAAASDQDESEDDLGLDDIHFTLERTNSGTAANDGVDFGSSAQADTSESFATIGSGATQGTLAAMSETAQLIYSTAIRTASASGSITDQSVRFDATYTLFGSAGYDLSQGNGAIEAEVTYTFYVA
ncbi:MAG: hypothetical protein AAGA72_06925 [Pseudomonadota bacterium]